MRRFAWCAAIALVPWLSGMLPAEGAAAPNRPDPEVSILSPADSTATNAATIAVRVHFRAKLVGKKEKPVGRVKAVILKADGVEAGRYAPSAKEQEGDCLFTLALSDVPDKVVALQAFAEQSGETVASDVVNLLVDRTPPVLSAALDPLPNAAGWNNSDVTVTFSATDALSGVVSVSAPVTVTAEGAGRVVSGSAADRAGNAGYAAVTVNLDRTVPAFNDISPAPGARIRERRPRFKADFTDSLSGVVVAAVRVRLDGNDFTGSIGGADGGVLTESGFSYNWPSDLPDGTHTLSVEGADRAGNTAMVASSFMVDAAAPEVQIASPVTVAAAEAVLAGTVSADTVSMTATGDTTAIVGSPVLSGTAFSVALSNLPPGGTTVTLTASDDLGNTSDPVTVLVVRQNAPPVVTLLSPADGADCRPGDMVTIEAMASDPDGAVTRVEIHDGDALLKTFETSPYRLTLAVPAGLHDITAAAVDDAGNRTVSARARLTAAWPYSAAKFGPEGLTLRGIRINNRGQVIGNVPRAFFWDGVTLSYLDVANATVMATGLNNLGDVVGNWRGDRIVSFFRSAAGAMTEMAPYVDLSNGYAVEYDDEPAAINDSRTIVGNTYYLERPVVWAGPGATPAPLMNAYSDDYPYLRGRVTAINNAGKVLGDVVYSSDRWGSVSFWRAVWWNLGNPVPAAFLNSDDGNYVYSHAVDINDRGEVLFAREASQDRTFRLWQNGEVTSVSSYGALRPPGAINASGTVVVGGGGYPNPFTLRTGTGEVVSAQSLCDWSIPAMGGMCYVNDINDLGQILDADVILSPVNLMAGEVGEWDEEQNGVFVNQYRVPADAVAMVVSGLLPDMEDGVVTLSVTTGAGKVRVRDADGVELALPYSWTAPGDIPAPKFHKVLFLEGVTPSDAPKDVELTLTYRRLGCATCGEANDKVLVTVGAIDMAVDGDRDGEIKFDNPEDRKLMFWVNDDHDVIHWTDSGSWEGMVNDVVEEDDIGSNVGDSIKDCQDNLISCRRDLEDFARLWVRRDDFNPATDQILFKWTNITSGSPGIRIFRAANENGDTGYLTDENVRQISTVVWNNSDGSMNNAYYNYDPYADRDNGMGLCKVVPGGVVDVTSVYEWQMGKPNYFIFEGVNPGTGDLEVRFVRSGVVMGKTRVRLELKKITDMYQRWTVGEDENAPPGNLADVGTFRYPAPQTPDERDMILFVHGYNLQTWEKDRYAETMYKRLWHTGYKGRFGLFRWPTTVCEYGTCFDKSELQAWGSAGGFLTLLNRLNAGGIRGKSGFWHTATGTWWRGRGCGWRGINRWWIPSWRARRRWRRTVMMARRRMRRSGRWTTAPPMPTGSIGRR
ncbi:MAG: Ig-like domain-containing protein [Planctomycetota bacterium]